MEQTLQLSLPNHPSAIESSSAAVGRFLDPHGLSARTLHRADVIVEELVSNLVRHAQGVSAIFVAAAVRDGEVEISVEDNGAPFNPFERAEPDPFTTIEEAELGGLGIMLVSRFSSSAGYERIGGRNRVTVRVAN